MKHHTQTISAPRARQAGFTLMELLIVVAIVGILAALAWPGYESYIRKTQRADARGALTTILQDQERLRANCSSYAGTLGSSDDCAASRLAGRTTSDGGRYLLSLSDANGTGFTAKATAQGAQTKDSACQELVLRLDRGNLTTSPSACW